MPREFVAPTNSVFQITFVDHLSNLETSVDLYAIRILRVKANLAAILSDKRLAVKFAQKKT